jgi:hypothetical protein
MWGSEATINTYMLTGGTSLDALYNMQRFTRMNWSDLGSRAAVVQPAVSGVKRSIAQGFEVFEVIFLNCLGCRGKKLFSPRFVIANDLLADGIRQDSDILTGVNLC